MKFYKFFFAAAIGCSSPVLQLEFRPLKWGIAFAFKTWYYIPCDVKAQLGPFAFVFYFGPTENLCSRRYDFHKYCWRQK